MESESIVRAVKRTWTSTTTIEGAGVRLKRAFGFHEVPELDPFLLLDDFQSANPDDYRRGFPWHPHRGIETITYVLDGEVEHRDSLGNSGIITSGDVQWMTAGGGILHEEMPRGDRRGKIWGFQLWANLPAAQKMMDPRYRDVKHGEIPLVTTAEGAEARVIAGEISGVRGPVRDIVIDPQYLDVSLPAGRTMTHRVNSAHTVFAYVIQGEGDFGPGEDDAIAGPPRDCRAGSLVVFGSGQSVIVTAGGEALRFLLVSGMPLRESVAWRGPVVMNTQEELRAAFLELQENRFVRTPRG